MITSMSVHYLGKLIVFNMKKIISILIISIFCSATALAEELYLACMVGMIEDRSTINVLQQVFGPVF